MQKKGDKLQEQIDAYNRGMMGVLDGEKAVTRSEQVATGTTSGRGQMGDMSFLGNNDEPMYVGLNGDDPDEIVNNYEDTKDKELAEINEMIQADIDYNNVLANNYKTREEPIENSLNNIGIISTIPELVTEDLGDIIKQIATDDSVYVTQEQYEEIKVIVNQNLSERYDTDAPTSSSTRENMLLLTLDKSREWSKEIERKGTCKDLEVLTGLLSETDSIYIINNLIRNSESVSKAFIVVDYDMQNELHDQAEMRIEEAEEFYKGYTTYLETAMDITSLGSSKVVRKLGELFTRAYPKLLGEVFDVNAPIVKEGNYMMYTTNYFEYYGLASNKEHDTMVLVEVNEDGTKKEQGYVYTFDYITDTRFNINQRQQASQGVGIQLPMKYTKFYDEIC